MRRHEYKVSGLPVTRAGGLLMMQLPEHFMLPEGDGLIGSVAIERPGPDMVETKTHIGVGPLPPGPIRIEIELDGWSPRS